MAKGYWIGRVDPTDPEAYKEYQALNAIPFAQYGARFLVRGGPFEAPEGVPRARNVVIEFPSYADALACYNSPEYQAAKAVRVNAGVGEVVIIEGYEGVQPGTEEG